MKKKKIVLILIVLMSLLVTYFTLNYGVKFQKINCLTDYQGVNNYVRNVYIVSGTLLKDDEDIQNEFIRFVEKNIPFDTISKYKVYNNLLYKKTVFIDYDVLCGVDDNFGEAEKLVQDSYGSYNYFNSVGNYLQGGITFTRAEKGIIVSKWNSRNNNKESVTILNEKFIKQFSSE
ncbi:hypothetical protein [Flavobacterium sp. H122]|uniref:hypothetical protein n=1 Tax=Flavobacterium sp. H122 TaxID=2529860 RepID=UPI00145B93C6|nr:hypothetical protein [Flavobacterium sp. H122]